MDMIMALLTNITRDMEIIKKTLERMNDKKVEVREMVFFLTSHCIAGS